MRARFLLSSLGVDRCQGTIPNPYRSPRGFPYGSLRPWPIGLVSTRAPGTGTDHGTLRTGDETMRTHLTPAEIATNSPAVIARVIARVIAKTRSIRVGDWAPDRDGLPAVGDRGYLVSTYHTVTGRRRHYLSDSPGCTNCGGLARLRGWLGTTHDVSEDAHGYVEVVQVSSHWVTVRELAEVTS